MGETRSSTRSKDAVAVDRSLGGLSSKKILVGVTGSIAAYKAAELVRLLKKAGAEVQVLMTPDAGRFITPLTLGTVSEKEVLTEIFPENEDGSWTRHVNLGTWADVFVVAPATATTIAKLVTGVCDSMLTATALSRRCPMLVCPAMDHDMFLHPATQRNLAALAADGAEIMPPEHGELASGLIGEGRMPEPEAIFERVRDLLTERQVGPSMAGLKVLVTAGPTREAFDPVRFLSNGSTGIMGFALAEVAARRGAEVVLVTGPVNLVSPAGVQRIDVTSADEMYQAVMQHSGADVVVGAAAVSDYAPAETAEHKLKKSDDDLAIRFRRTPDILAAIGAQKRHGQTVVGFALETQNEVANARAKLEGKQLDWIVLNRAGEAGSGFGSDTNKVTLLSRDGRAIELPQIAKREVAEHIFDHVLDSVEQLPGQQ